VTPAGSTSAACCNVWDFSTLGWQLSNKYYTDCRNGWKGRDGNFWAVSDVVPVVSKMSVRSRAEVALKVRSLPF
jgi:hypothetical protein